MNTADVRALLGDTDIYLLDQVLRGRLEPPMRVLDAGCGGGRNFAYLLRAGFEVHGVDSSAAAVRSCRELAGRLAPGTPTDRFREADLGRLPHGDGSFDAVLAIAVLHFAADFATWQAWVADLLRVLRPGGLFFSRLATTITMECFLPETTPGRYRLPDGSDRFLVDERTLLETGVRLGAELADPIKTTHVQGLRAMTTWVLRRKR